MSKVRSTESRRCASLQHVQTMRVQNGSSLPLDKQLRRLPNFKAISAFLVLCYLYVFFDKLLDLERSKSTQFAAC